MYLTTCTSHRSRPRTRVATRSRVAVGSPPGGDATAAASLILGEAGVRAPSPSLNSILERRGARRSGGFSSSHQRIRRNSSVRHVIELPPSSAPAHCHGNEVREEPPRRRWGASRRQGTTLAARRTTRMAGVFPSRASLASAPERRPATMPARRPAASLEVNWRRKVPVVQSIPQRRGASRLPTG